MCTGNSNSFLHSESFEIMVCLVDGTQEYMLMEPKYARVIGPEWDMYRFYNIDVEAVNMTAYPGLLEVPWYGATVDKGDCLYIPYEWIRYVGGMYMCTDWIATVNCMCQYNTSLECPL